MRYSVPVEGVEHLFHLTEKGLDAAKELAIASQANIYLDEGGKRKEIVYRGKSVAKIGKKIKFALDGR